MRNLQYLFTIPSEGDVEDTTVFKDENGLLFIFGKEGNINLAEVEQKLRRKKNKSQNGE